MTSTSPVTGHRGVPSTSHEWVSARYERPFRTYADQSFGNRRGMDRGERDRDVALERCQYRLVAKRVHDHAGGPDGLISATALEHDLTLVTRNVRDFEGLGVSVIAPWK